MNLQKSIHLLFSVLALVLVFSLAAPVMAAEEPTVETTEETIEPTYNTLKPGTILTFGTYPQEGEEDPLEWIVLTCEEGVATLTTRYAVETMAFHDRKTEVTWEDSEIRRWLNEDFYNTAFSEADKELILQSYLQNRDNPQYPADGGESTFDYVYLMSYDEVMASIPNRKNRILRTTARSRDQGIDLSKNDTCWWLLRTPGETQKSVLYIDQEGAPQNSGTGVTAKKGGIRPTIHILVP